MIKMKINNIKYGVCSECGCVYANTPEMYDMLIAGYKFTLCKDCVEAVFQKTLKAGCKYDAKVKTKEDQERIKRYNVMKGRKEK